MKGRVLVDVPRLGLKCGEFAEVEDGEAKALVADGAFDPKAVEEPEQKQPKHKK